MLRIVLVIALLLTAVLGAQAAAGHVALVIGVSNYEHASVLTNTPNDARDVAAALKRLHFEVELTIDPSRSALEEALRRYGEKSAGADVTVFYYSGHALEATGRNWLLPASANLKVERDLRFEAVDLNSILEQADAAKVALIFLDACRDNPFLHIPSVRRDLTARGLTRVEPTTTGMLVAFSTAPGQVALDGNRRNSPFTGALLKHIETPGLELRSMLSLVTKDVLEETKGKQRPWVNSSLEGDFYFVVPSTPTVATPAPTTVNLEAVFWDSIKGSRDPADFRAYLAKFPNGTFAELAQNRIAMLTENGPTSQTPHFPPQAVAAAPPLAGPRPAIAPTLPQELPAAPFKPGEVLKDCLHCPELVVVPPGEFMMGSNREDIALGTGAENEFPRHKITIKQPIAVGRFEVTRDEFEAFVSASGHEAGNRCYTFEQNKPQERADRSFRNPGYAQDGNHPAVCVSWSDAKAYVDWISQTTGRRYRLLSEAEWEYVALGSETRKPQDGHKDLSELCRSANGADQSAKLAGLPVYSSSDCNDGHVFTSPVGTFKANAFGIHDLLGNVWEWSADCYSPNYMGSPADGSAFIIANCLTRTVRGGSWFSTASTLRPAARAGAPANARHDDIGFRVARPLSP